MEHTFVICAYKESPYLEECIQSLKKQTMESMLLLATSTPSAFLENLCIKYEIEYVVRDGEPSIGVDWNQALSVANTKYVTIAHQDDFYETEYARTMVNHMNATENNASKPIIAFSDYYELQGTTIYKNNLNLCIKRFILSPLKHQKKQANISSKRGVLKYGNAICCPSVTFNKRYIDELIKKDGRGEVFNGHMRSNLDWEAWEWLSSHQGAFVYVRKQLMGHRIHAGSETTAIIQDNMRGEEDYEMFCKFWSPQVAKFFAKVYSLSEKGNKIK